MDIGEAIYLTERAEWRRWLAEHHTSKTEIWLIHYRKIYDKPRISYNDAVEEALCFGWIDSIIKTLGEQRLVQRYSVRKKSSGLSQINKERVWNLIASRQMTPAGLAAIAHAFDPERDKPENVIIPPDILAPLKANTQAWEHFQTFSDAYKRIRIAYIETRKRHGVDHFRRALDNFIAKSAKGKLIGVVKEMKER